MTKKILIYLEHKNNEIIDVSKQLISKSYAMAKDFQNTEIVGVVISNADNDFTYLSQFGLNRVIFCKTLNLDNYSTVEYANIFTSIVNKENPDIVLIGATKQGRDLAPRVAGALQTGLTADCTQLDIAQDFKLVATRPTFGGSLMAQIMCKTLPQMATVRPNIFSIICIDNATPVSVETCVFDNSSCVEILKKEEKTESIYTFEGADVILAGGIGLKNKENFELLKKLADKIGAKVGATRKAVDRGLVEKQCQIGQTGQTVNPKIYIAFGISGAIQHISGIENSKVIVAVNPDKTAQIHQYADYCIYEDAITFIKNWLNQQ